MRAAGLRTLGMECNGLSLFVSATWGVGTEATGCYTRQYPTDHFFVWQPGGLRRKKTFCAIADEITADIRKEKLKQR